MPLRPDLPGGFNLSRRPAGPVKLPRMSFPMVGGPPESAGQVTEESFEPPVPLDAQEEMTMAPMGMQNAPQNLPMSPGIPVTQPVPAAQMPVSMPPGFASGQPEVAPVDLQPQPIRPEPARVIVYGRSNCQACIDAVQDLIDRGVTFTYHDVSRDEQAMAHLQSITAGNPVVPVVIYIGYGGT